MKLEVRVSTIIIFIICQTIISVGFYLGDRFVSGGEAVITLLASIPLTMFVQWIREISSLPPQNDSE
jgi:hypothetical protein